MNTNKTSVIDEAIALKIREKLKKDIMVHAPKELENIKKTELYKSSFELTEKLADLKKEFEYQTDQVEFYEAQVEYYTQKVKDIKLEYRELDEELEELAGSLSWDYLKSDMLSVYFDKSDHELRIEFVDSKLPDVKSLINYIKSFAEDFGDEIYSETELIDKIAYLNNDYNWD